MTPAVGEPVPAQYPAPDRSAGRYAGAAAVVVAVLTLVVFLPALQNGFVNWDDEQNFVMNPQYRGLGPANLVWMLTTFHMGPYQPLSWLTLGLDYTLWGMNPLGYHLTNVLLHAVNAGLVCLLVLRLLRRAPGETARDSDGRLALGAAVGALVWAVHPLRVESVAWVTERRDVLSGLFVLLALLVYVERPAAARPLVVVLGALALLAKAVAMVLPALLLVLDVYPLRRLGGAVGWTSSAARRVLLEKVPLLALSAVAAVLAVIGQRAVGTLVPLDAMSPGARLGTFLYQVGLYLRKTLLPVRLEPVYEFPAGMGLLHPLALAGGATLLALLGAAWVGRTRWPAVGAAVAVYLIAFAPTTGIVQAGAHAAADRYTYLPALAWAPLVAGAIAWPASGRAAVRVSLGALAVLLLVPLTVRQISFWRDSVTLWERGLALAPGSAIVHHWLARAYLDDGRLDDMVALYDRWLREDGDRNPQGWGDYGMLLALAGLDDRALPALEKAIAAQVGGASTYYARALVRDRSGDAAGALADYDESLRLDPEQGFPYYNRALIRRMSGDLRGALADFARALTFERVRMLPMAFTAYANYGIALADAGQLDAGLQAVRTAVDLAPPDSRARIEQLLQQLEARRAAGKAAPGP